MFPQQARMFIEQILVSPSIPYAQMLVESNINALNDTFFQVLNQMIQEAQMQGSSFSLPSSIVANLPDSAADIYFNQASGGSQRLQGLQMLQQYAWMRRQQMGFQSVPQQTPLQVTCYSCRMPFTVFCPGFGVHMPSPSVVASPLGGVCTICGGQFTSATCLCGVVNTLGHHTVHQPEPHVQPDFNSLMGSQLPQTPQQAPAPDPEAPSELFKVLMSQYEAEKSRGRFDPVRQQSLEQVLGKLGSMAGKVGTDRSLADMQSERMELDSMMAGMMTQLKSASHPGPELAMGSPAKRVYDQLAAMKTYLGSEGMRQGVAEKERELVMDLFVRIARVTTAVNAAGENEAELLAVEIEQARPIVNEIRTFARRSHLTLAQPVWGHRTAPLDPNSAFYSGSEETRRVVTRALGQRGFSVSEPIRFGADPAAARWSDLQQSSLAIFDLAAPTPQVYYELGIALALGTELLLIKLPGANLPFDVAQGVVEVSNDLDLDEFLNERGEEVIYGLQAKGVHGASLQETLQYAEELAAAVPESTFVRISAQQARTAVSDPIMFRDAIASLNGYLGEKHQMLIWPRWQGVYPDPDNPRCFFIMPFRQPDPDANRLLNATFQWISWMAETNDVRPIRGDVASGHEVIASIWEEIGRASRQIVDLTGLNLNVCMELGMADVLGRRTLLIGQTGTEKRLADEFPSIAKRRCHPYADDPANEPMFANAVQHFLSTD